MVNKHIWSFTHTVEMVMPSHTKSVMTMINSPVSGAEQLKISGAHKLVPMASQTWAYSKLLHLVKERKSIAFRPFQPDPTSVTFQA